MSQYNNLPSLEDLLDLIGFDKLEAHQAGTNWVGTRYSLRTYNYGSSPVYKTFDEIKVWIIKHVTSADIKYGHLLKEQQ